MQNIADVDNNSQVNDSFQVIITSITWNKKSIRTNHVVQYSNDSDLPSQMTFDIPEGVLQQARGKKNVFNDVIETYIYNVLTKKFGHEVYHCQIWLPLDATTAA